MTTASQHTSRQIASVYLESFLVTIEENINSYSSWIKKENKQRNAMQWAHHSDTDYNK